VIIAWILLILGFICIGNGYQKGELDGAIEAAFGMMIIFFDVLLGFGVYGYFIYADKETVFIPENQFEYQRFTDGVVFKINGAEPIYSHDYAVYKFPQESFITKTTTKNYYHVVTDVKYNVIPPKIKDITIQPGLQYVTPDNKGN